MEIKLHNTPIRHQDLAIEVQTYRYDRYGNVVCVSTSLEKLDPMSNDQLSQLLKDIQSFNEGSRESSRIVKTSWKVKKLIKL